MALKELFFTEPQYLYPADVKISPVIAQMLFVQLVCPNRGPNKVPKLHLVDVFLKCPRRYYYADQKKPDMKEDILYDSTDMFQNR